MCLKNGTPPSKLSPSRLRPTLTGWIRPSSSSRSKRSAQLLPASHVQRSASCRTAPKQCVIFWHTRLAITFAYYACHQHQLVRIALRSATGCGYGPRETMSTSNPIFDRMLEALLSRHVRSNSSDPKQLDVIDAFTGEVLATTSDEPVQFSKVYHSQTRELFF